MKLKEGDVFSISLTVNEVGFGQVIAFPNRSTIMIVLFNHKEELSTNYNIEVICTSKIVFIGCTYDAKLYHNDWIIVGNYKANLTSINLPVYKLGTPPIEIYLVDYKGKKLRSVSLKEFNTLHYQTFIAPVRFENALKAFFKLQEWRSDDYDKILYNLPV